MIALPTGYTLETTERRARKAAQEMFGDNWQVTVYCKGYPAFKLAKQWAIDAQAPEYAGKLVHDNGAWLRSNNLRELVKIMCTKHRIGVGR